MQYCNLYWWTTNKLKKKTRRYGIRRLLGIIFASFFSSSLIISWSRISTATEEAGKCIYFYVFFWVGGKHCKKGKNAYFPPLLVKKGFESGKNAPSSFLPFFCVGKYAIQILYTPWEEVKSTFSVSTTCFEIMAEN